jgi:NADH-quinone oxidoreductase subunit N
VYLFMREPVPGAPAAEPMRSGFVRAAVLLAALGVVVLGLSATPLEAVTASALLP